MIDLLLIKISILLIACAIASVTDLRNGTIPDKLTLPLIAIAILFNFFEFFAVNFFPAIAASFNLLNFSLMNFLPGIAVFLCFLLLYYTGKLGGGDVKFFTGIALLIPFHEGFPFIVSVLFFSSLFAVLFFSVYYSLKYFRLGINFKENQKGILQASFLAIFLLAYFFLLTYLNFMQFHSATILAIPLFCALLFIAFQQGIKRNFFLKQIPLAELEEDEVIAKEFLSKELEQKISNSNLSFKVKGIITDSDKEKLKKLGISSLPVLRSLPPFAPFIFLGTILALLMPDFLSLLFLFP